jgi:hypothetical protein
MTVQAPALTVAYASRLARVALGNVVSEFPAKQDHTLAAASDAKTPRALHPAFYGSFDWHSCVHMHWSLARLRRLFPTLPERAAIDRVFDAHLNAAAIAAELDYLTRPASAAFERPYGWAWLLELARELGADDDPDARRWSKALVPLAQAFALRFRAWLPRADYPVRYGMHANGAFALAFAIDYARATGDGALEHACTSRALAWFGDDRDAPADWEPSGADFLSPSLVESDLMRRVLPHDGFGAWLDGFLPALARGEPASLFAPVRVSDRADPHIVHLDGLNLSRAWSMTGIANALPLGDPRAVTLELAAKRHVDAGLVGLDSADYMGAHWLASFALLALTEQ